jgi:hypothetical protein
MSGARDLDKMLAEWPVATPTDSEREDFAARVVDSINAASTPAAGDLDALLAPPLPPRESEGNLATPARPGDARASLPPVAGLENKMSKDRAKDRTSFQELAKLAGTPAPPAATPSVTPPPAAVVRAEEGGSDDSGIVDLKMVAQLDPAANERAKTTPLAASGLFDEEAPASAAAAAASAPPPSVVGATAQSAPRPPVASVPPPSATPSVSPAAATPSVAPKKEEKKGGGMILLFGGLAAAIAIAAGAFFVIKSSSSGDAKTAATTPAQPAATTPTTKTTATAAASVAAVDTTQQQAGGVDMDSLPTTVDTNGKRIMPKINAAGAKPTGSVATADSATPAATGTVDPRLVANNIPNGGGGGGGDLTEAMRAAAGGGTAAAATATTTGPTYAPGSVPQKPSQGQVQGAINAVLPEARKCMAEGDPISRANIVFQSDGTVQSVSVSGFAAGKPNEACVKAAFQKAKISPFAEASYSFPVTVRPM